MEDELENHGDPSPNPARPSLEVEIEARALIDALLENQIGPEQRHRLETLVIENPAVAQLYVEVVHLWFSIPLHVARRPIDLAADTDLSPAAADSMNESLVLPALHETFGVEEEPAITLPPSLPISVTPPRKSRQPIWWGSTAAAIIIIGISIFVSMRSHQTPAPPAPSQLVAAAPARITANAGLRASAAVDLTPGTLLAVGQELQVGDGAVELSFASGAVAVVQGPAKIRIISDNAMALESGAMTAHVPTEAKGFLVSSPGLSVVDQGTNFGVRATAGGTASEAHVFEGKVQVSGMDSGGQPTSPVINATAGQAFKHDVAAAESPVPIPCAPAAFVRDITAIRIPIHMPGTGDDAAPGSPDPAWQIISVPDNANWKPKHATVMSGLPESYNQEVAEGKWIGVNGKLDNQPVGTFTFRTTVDLTDFDPASVSITATVAADDYVSDILINGVRTGLSTSPDNPNFHYAKTKLLLPATGWRKGINQIDLQVPNSPNTVIPNGMLLHVEWTATALAAVHR